MPLELFNQTAQTSIAARTVKRLAYAQPSQAGAENITIENFCINEIGLTGTTGNVAFLNNTTKKVNFDTVFTFDAATDMFTFPKWKPAADGVDALRFFKTDGTTEIFSLSITGLYPTWDYEGHHRFNNAGSTTGSIQINNSAQSYDGLQFNLLSANAVIDNTEGGYLSFQISSVEKIQITSTDINFYDSAGDISNILKLTANADNNTIMGNGAASAINIANNCTLYGFNAGVGLVGGINNVFIGSSSGSNTFDNSYNVTVGHAAMNQGDSNYSTALGYGAAYQAAGDFITAIGMVSGYGIGEKSVCVGSYAGRYETSVNKLYIDSIDRSTEAAGRTNSLIYGIFNVTPSSQKLTVNGDLLVTYNQGINVTPTVNLQIGGGAGASTMKFSNTATGNAVGDGTDFGIDSSGNAFWNNKENTYSSIKVNNIEAVNISTDITFYKNQTIQTSSNASLNIKSIVATAYSGVLFSEDTTDGGSIALYGSNYTTASVRNSIGIVSAIDNVGKIIFVTKTSTSYYERAALSNNGRFAFSGTSLLIHTPASMLHVDDSGGASEIRFTAGGVTGLTSTSGTTFGIDTSGNASIFNYKSGAYVRIATNSVERIKVQGDGHILLSQNLSEYADDAAAAATVPINGLYKTGSFVKIRVV